MALVGKKFPNFEVDAMNEMGDTFKLNVLEEAQKNNKKVLLFWYPKDFTFVRRRRCDDRLWHPSHRERLGGHSRPRPTGD